MKCFKKFCMLAIVITLVARSVESAPFLSLQNEYSDQHYNEYVMFDYLEKLLVNNPFNIYQLQTTFYSDDLVLCLPVAYEMDCINDTMDTNCTLYSTEYFLWTFFDTETFAGRVLLFFTKNNLRSPLFGIKNKFCQYSQETCGITLYLNFEMSQFPVLRGNVSIQNLISNTLLKITKKLNNYATYIDGKQTEFGTDGGYSVQWESNKEDEFKANTHKSEIIIPATLIPVALCVGFSGGLQILHFIKERVKKNEGPHVYYIFWSFQFVAALINGLHTWYIPEISIKVLVPVITFMYSVIVVIKYTIIFEVPCNEFVHEHWKTIMSVFATWNTFKCFIYIAYTLPWIILGFYLYPIQILVRISAIIAAGMLIIANFYIILLHFEEFIEKWKCSNFINCHSRVKRIYCQEYFNRSTSSNKYQSIATDDGNSNTGTGSNNWEAVVALSKCITGVLVLLCFGGMGYLLHHIIFVFTNEVRTAVIELLHIIPLIVLSLGAYLIRNLLKLHESEKNPKAQGGNAEVPGQYPPNNTTLLHYGQTTGTVNRGHQQVGTVYGTFNQSRPPSTSPDGEALTPSPGNVSPPHADAPQQTPPLVQVHQDPMDTSQQPSSLSTGLPQAP